MTKDDVIRLANEAELCQCIWIDTEDEVIKSLVLFAKLVAEHEREACAKLCDDLLAPPHIADNDVSIWDVASIECADAIRQRGEA